VVTECHSPRMQSLTRKLVWAHCNGPTGSAPDDRNTRGRANSYGTTWALYGPHLPLKARRENRSRQEKRYGKHTVHIQSSIHFREALGLLPTRGMICCPRQRLIDQRGQYHLPRYEMSGNCKEFCQSRFR
jgi:hypothetical protein